MITDETSATLRFSEPIAYNLIGAACSEIEVVLNLKPPPESKSDKET